eukprot:9492980-Pyramimonas_sp.AAC.1
MQKSRHHIAVGGYVTVLLLVGRVCWRVSNASALVGAHGTYGLPASQLGSLGNRPTAQEEASQLNLRNTSGHIRKSKSDPVVGATMGKCHSTERATVNN